jgi:DNA-binding response OmpR family regulator
MDDLDLLARPAPTPQRPLLGQTVLVVEDSRFASEAVRLLALRSGARIRRADTLASAERHLNTYRAGIAIVDLGLPDGSGLELISRLAKATQRPTVLLGTSGAARNEAESEVLEAGADGFLPKPIERLAAFQHAIMQHMPQELWPRGLRSVGTELVEPDRLALAEDLARAEQLLSNGTTPDFIADFLQGLARTGHDEDLLAATENLSTLALEDMRPHLSALIAERLGKRAVV